MANTYSKIYVHIIFAVRNRDALLSKEWRPQLFSYISGIILNKGHHALAINGHNDHIHILLDYKMNDLLPDLVREIKKSSTKFIKENNLCNSAFNWQKGYGAFSVDWKSKDVIIKYINNQEAHHNKNTFKKEYIQLLETNDINYKTDYLFDFVT